ncbi:MAG: bifunctional diaminohydroxyphosphoribosylaminopyrimidine deaminase/5-amino-6-(5-phosphoribosylamino)uracil reductase RibD [Burkholderiaceae bacterium]|nr:bifunctional diaminohydroxyphosphoribosylaminopyrimidine deaminase/5-amino-6-(5-phosphoribosylamino)uracil reductase RibD [Burkholderiaceae bacterium]
MTATPTGDRSSSLAACRALADQAVGVCDPNPRVGCVITRENGELIATGQTQQAGHPHAEIMALRAARDVGHDLRGATAYVSLEPCSHHGRTPPCCDALIEAGIARVVVAIEDPNPLVAGRGIARLRAAGIAVEVVGGEWGNASRELNIGFFSRMVRARPWVRMKVAVSLDGRTALDSGASQWITGAAARADGHAWRKRAGALLTGIGTVREDDPRLDVRLVPTEIQPLRVVLDSRLDIAASARVLQPPGRALIYTASDDAVRIAALAAPHLEVARLPANAHGKTDLAAMLADLARREVNELHVEAGEKLNGSLLREGLVDELLLYVAPRLLGAGRGIAAIGPLASLAESLDFEFVDVERVGADLRLRLRPPGGAEF